MKYLLLAVFALSTLVTPQQKVLKGKYKMRFEKQYGNQSGMVIFDKNTYVRRGTDGKAIKGTVEYTKDVVILKDESTNYQVEVSAKTIGKDTVQFRTVDVAKSTDKRGDIIFFPGKMIKLKEK